MSQSSIAECWLHKWWRCLPLCIGPWCSIVRWRPIVQSEIHTVYTYIINAICGSKTSLTIERKWNRQKRFEISVDTSFICAIYMCVNKRKVIQLIDWLIPEGETERKRERECERERGRVRKQLLMNMENSWSWPWKCLKAKRPEPLQKYANICIFISTVSVSFTHMTHTHIQPAARHTCEKRRRWQNVN